MQNDPSFEDADASERAVWPAIWRGMRKRCPRCGEGRVFRGYLSVREGCDACAQSFEGQRADDMPPWITIMIVGHLVGPGILFVERGYMPEMWVHMVTWPTLVIALSLAILPIAKGGVIGMQWALRLHGFGRDGD